MAEQEKTAGLCCTCRKNVAGKPERISFMHDGFRFTVESGFECGECARKECLEEFERFGRGLVRLENNELKVDWQSCLEELSRRDSSEVLHILISLGILSPLTERNWEIMADGPIGLNPRLPFCYLFFTRQQDVVAFARLKYAGTYYGWEIRHIDRVIYKETVLKEADG